MVERVAARQVARIFPRGLTPTLISHPSIEVGGLANQPAGSTRGREMHTARWAVRLQTQIGAKIVHTTLRIRSVAKSKGSPMGYNLLGAKLSGV